MAIQAQSPLLGTRDLMENGWVNHSFFGLQQQQQQRRKIQELQQQQQILNQNQMYQNQNLLVSNTLKNSMINTNNSLPSIPFYQRIAAQEEKYRQEMDQNIRLQNERLRLMLSEQRKQQLGIVLEKIESTTLPLLRQKDEEIALATRRAMELEDFLKRLEMENQTWQRISQENEAMVVSLNSQLEQLLDDNNYNNVSSGGFNGGEAEDAESCCDVDEEKKTEMNREDETMMVCRGCKSRNSCVLFLPCRHLGSCQTCQVFLDSCPICNTVKNASIEVLL